MGDRVREREREGGREVVGDEDFVAFSSRRVFGVGLRGWIYFFVFRVRLVGFCYL